MARITLTLMAVVVLVDLAGCSMTGREQTQSGGEASMAEYTPPADTYPAVSGPDDTLIDRSEQDVLTLLNGCLRRINERDDKALLGMMNYWGECRNLDIQDGKMIWMRRG